MKYKILPNTPLFAALLELYLDIRQSEYLAELLVTEAGADGYMKFPGYLAGPARYFIFRNNIPAVRAWRKLVRLNDCYYPKPVKANENIREKLKHIPKVPSHRLADLVGSTFQIYVTGEEVMTFSHPVVQYGQHDILMTFPDRVVYHPKPGAVLISEEEYLDLETRIKPNWWQPDCVTATTNYNFINIHGTKVNQ